MQKQDDQLEITYRSYVKTQDVTLKTCRRRWMIGRSGERGSGISVLAAKHDDDDDDDDLLIEVVQSYKYNKSRAVSVTSEVGLTTERNLSELSVSCCFFLFVSFYFYVLKKHGGFYTSTISEVTCYEPVYNSYNVYFLGNIPLIFCNICYHPFYMCVSCSLLSELFHFENSIYKPTSFGNTLT